MQTRVTLLGLFILINISSQAQRAKVQAAWRNLTDYEETLKEGRPELAYLTKANTSIDLALAHPDTKDQTKAHAYKMRISYAFFQYALNEENKKLEGTIGDKNERILTAYGNTSLDNFEAAISELNKIGDLDSKYIELVQKGLADGAGNLNEDDLKFALAAQQMKIESANIASGKYKAQQYGTAADFFYRTAVMNSVLYKTMDTSNFYNACVSASKAKDAKQIITYNKKMVEAKLSMPYNYDALYQAYLGTGDTTEAAEILKKGRQAFPDDAALLTEETNLFLEKGRQQDALVNLKQAIRREPANALYYFIIGNIYDNMANPRDKTTNKELERPVNFTELFKNAETNYQQAIDLNPSNKDYLYNALYNLGAMYNNYGGSLGNKAATAKGAEGIRQQKENEAQAQEFYKKAIPYLERAMIIKSDDRPTMTALRKLYIMIGQKEKAEELGRKLKN
jgi:hypothetical protein